VQLGRQIVSEVPLNIYDADSGQVRVGLGGPFSATVFGGQPRYWEPTYGSPSLSQNEQIFGGSVRMARFDSGALALGFLQQNRQGREIKQLVTGSGTRAFPKLPGIAGTCTATSPTTRITRTSTSSAPGCRATSGSRAC
jgi:hypothetical protein